MAAWVLLWAVAASSLALSIWAIADATATPAEAFNASGLSRKRWLMVLVFFTIVLDVIGVIVAIVYLTTVRPKVRPLRAA